MLSRCLAVWRSVHDQFFNCLICPSWFDEEIHVLLSGRLICTFFAEWRCVHNCFVSCLVVPRCIRILSSILSCSPASLNEEAFGLMSRSFHVWVVPALEVDSRASSASRHGEVRTVDSLFALWSHGELGS